MKPKKSTKVKEFNIWNDTFKFQLLVRIGGSLQETVNKYASLVNEEPWTVDNKSRLANFGALQGNLNGYIWFPSDPAIPIVVHELLHALAYFMEILVIPLNRDTEEVYTYTMEWLLKEFLAKK